MIDRSIHSSGLTEKRLFVTLLRAIEVYYFVMRNVVRNPNNEDLSFIVTYCATSALMVCSEGISVSYLRSWSVLKHTACKNWYKVQKNVT